MTPIQNSSRIMTERSLVCMCIFNTVRSWKKSYTVRWEPSHSAGGLLVQDQLWVWLVRCDTIVPDGRLLVWNPACTSQGKNMKTSFVPKSEGHLRVMHLLQRRALVEQEPFEIPCVCSEHGSVMSPKDTGTRPSKCMVFLPEPSNHFQGRMIDRNQSWSLLYNFQYPMAGKFVNLLRQEFT